MKQLLKLKILIVLAAIVLTACGGTNLPEPTAQPTEPRSKVVPYTIKYFVDSDVKAILPAYLPADQSGTFILTEDAFGPVILGDFSWLENPNLPENTTGPEYLVGLYISVNIDPKNRCYGFIEGNYQAPGGIRFKSAEDLDGNPIEPDCLSTSGIDIIVNVKNKTCDLTAEGAVTCYDYGNWTIEVGNNYFHFTVYDEVDPAERDLISDSLVFWGYDPALLPEKISPDASYRITK